MVSSLSANLSTKGAESVAEPDDLGDEHAASAVADTEATELVLIKLRRFIGKLGETRTGIIAQITTFYGFLTNSFGLMIHQKICPGTLIS